MRNPLETETTDLPRYPRNGNNQHQGGVAQAGAGSHHRERRVGINSLESSRANEGTEERAAFLQGPSKPEVCEDCQTRTRLTHIFYLQESVIRVERLLLSEKMVHRVVHQHHPVDIQYSLEDVNPNPTAFASRLNNPDEDVKVIGYTLPDGEIWVLYTPGTSGTVDDLADEFDPDELNEELEGMDPSNRVIAIWLLNFLAEMQEEERELGNDLSIYKELEIEKIPDAIEQVDWEGSVTDVAGRLMSNLILRHSLPNANHRTGITMAQAYLEAAGADFEMPSTITEEYDWRSWVQSYIVESKRILTVRRHNLYFKVLEELGCEIVRRKHEIDIHLVEYDLDMHYHEAWEIHATMHEEHCIGFVEDVAARADSLELIERDALSKEDFVEFLRMENQEPE